MTLSYQIEGEGPPLLLIHGMGVTYTIWRNLVPLLRPHYKLIMAEMPGHGASPALPPGEDYYQYSAEQVEILRRELKINQWSLLGYSMGAWVAQAYLQKYPQRASGVIFLCPAVLTRMWSFSLKGLIRLDRIYPAFSGWLLQSWRLHWLVRLLGFNGQEHPYAQVWTHEIASQPVDVIKALLGDLPGAGRAEFPTPSCPTWVIWGAKDSVTARPNPLRLFDRLVNGSHSAPMLAAGEVALLIREFLVSETVSDDNPEHVVENKKLSIEGAL